MAQEKASLIGQICIQPKIARLTGQRPAAVKVINHYGDEGLKVLVWGEKFNPTLLNSWQLESINDSGTDGKEEHSMVSTSL